MVLKGWVKGEGLPPHEFAYGAALRNPEAIPERMNQFLSLEDVDPSEIQIETYVGNSSEKNLKPLIRYILSQKKHDFRPLVASLENVERLSNQKQKAIELVKALLPYKDSLRNESQQDSVIVFVSYGFKQPASLSQAARAKVSSFVKQLDTAKQSVS